MIIVFARLATQAAIATESRASMPDTHCQHGHNAFMQAGQLLLTKRICRAQRMDAGKKQCFISVDIAKTRYDFLSKEHSFYWSFAYCKKSLKNFNGKLIAQRL